MPRAFVCNQELLYANRLQAYGFSQINTNNSKTIQTTANRLQAYGFPRINTNNNRATETTAKMYAKLLDLAIYPLPVELPKIDMHLYWHTNLDFEPANKWLRNKVIQATPGI